MALEEIDVAPTIESYKPLSEHEEQTPPTFFGGPPVLYLYSPKATVVVSKSQLEETPVLKRLRSAESTDELDGEANVDIAIDNVDIWVSSRYGLA
jgi:nucleotide-sensitive chloride channel 1A